MEQNHRYQIPFFFVIFTAIVVVLFMMLRPFVNTLVVAATLAVVLWPLDQKLEQWLRGRAGIAAAISVLVANIIIIGPLSFLGFQIFEESKSLYNALSSGTAVTTDLKQVIEEPLRQIFPQYHFDVTAYMREAFGYIRDNIGPFFTATLQTVVSLIIGVLALFYFLKDGPLLKERIIFYSPLAERADHIILDSVAKSMNSVIKGSLLIGVIQGIIAGIGYAIFGVPNATLWGSVTAIASLIPGVGTTVVLAPAIFYLFIMGQTVQGVGLLIWGALAVGLIDNILQPYLVGKVVNIHPFLILLSVLGGIGVFGPLGFLIGPIVLSLFVALLNVYQSVILKINKS
jgi:predicted PurR-regulated permease PerM